MAHRCTLFLMDEKKDMLTARFTFSSDRSYEQVGLKEEKELMQTILLQSSPFLLGKAGDFSKFPKLKRNGGMITSLMGVPLSSEGKKIGVLSAVLINEENYNFDEKSLNFFSGFANLALVSLKNANRIGELQKEKALRMNYEGYIDNILYRLQVKDGAEEKSQVVESPVKKLKVEGEEEKKEIPQYQKEEGVAWVHGSITLKEKSGVNLRQDERVETIFRVEFENADLAFTKNLSKGGAFIQTIDPLELGDIFLLKLHLADGGEPIEVESKVIWANKYTVSKDLRKGMGVKFLNLQPENQKRIEEYVKSRKVAVRE
jgi:uncharacterized protein (TIGR02266 family)